MGCLSALQEKKNKTTTTTAAQCGPLVTGNASADALQWFFLHSLLPSAVLSLCSHTVWVFTVKSTADLKKILHTEVAFKGRRVLVGKTDGFRS